ncbi:T9SS type A sorting domain-containing protein [Flavobacterium sp.]|uniref:T9SS type A sorting domain-containing protein n=1 Tax=Flavobacterium sp. TaxID=239 RepID=UPI0039E2B7E0
MKHRLLTLILLTASMGYAQSVIQSVNSGSLITTASSVSIGEIIVNSVNANQSSSGMIGILATHNATLEVTRFELTENITVYPNPTAAKLFFSGKDNLAGKKVSVYDQTGKCALQTAVSEAQSIDLETLPTGIFLIQFQDKTFQTFTIIKH